MGKIFEPTSRIEIEYRQALIDLAEKIIEITSTIDDIDELIDTLKAIVNYSNFFPEYGRLCEAVAQKMVTQVVKANAQTWRQAASQSRRGRQIYELLNQEIRASPLGRLMREQIERNAKIIKSLPLQIAQDITKYVSHEQLKGRRASEIAKDILKMYRIHSIKKAKLIARTEVSKSQCAIMENRCRLYGVNWYIWRSVGGNNGDGRTRESHKKMNGIIINWNEPPNPEKLFPSKDKYGRPIKPPANPYHAGNIYNCRCYAEPIINIEAQCKFPMKVYMNGRIQKMSYKRFMAMMK